MLGWTTVRRFEMKASLTLGTGRLSSALRISNDFSFPSQSEISAAVSPPACFSPKFTNPAPQRPDISFAVINDRAKRPCTARRSEVVNNCAASHNSAGGRPALARSRSRKAYRKTVRGRPPGEPAALAPTSNRTKPQEGHYIRLMDSRAKRRKSQKQQKQTMNDSQQWQQHRAFGALDWASDLPCSSNSTRGRARRSGGSSHADSFQIRRVTHGTHKKSN
jgi:hypothetical protein